MPRLVLAARDRLAQTSQQEALSRPYAYLTLENTLTEGEDEIANFYVFQKVFSGEFQVLS